MGLLQDLIQGQKAIPSTVPALMDGEPLTILNRGNDVQKEYGRISQKEAKRHFEGYGGNQAMDWLMDCVRLYSDAAKEAGYYFERENGKRVELYKNDETPDETEILNDSRLKILFEQPNPFMLWCDLIELLVIDLLVVGNGYWYKWRQTADGKPIALYRLAPQYVNIVPGAFGVDHYEYQPPGAQEPLELLPQQVMHFKLPNPHNPYFGLGIIQGGGRAFDLELALTDSQAHYLENKSDPSMVLSSERRVPRDVFNKLLMQLRSRTRRHSTGELLLLESGLKPISISRNSADSIFPDLTDMSRDRILAMFRVSPRLLGVGGPASSGADKDADVRQEFDNYTMRPFLNRLSKLITHGLLRPWELEMCFDYSPVLPAGVILENAATFAKMPGVKVKEIRRFLGPLGVLDGESTGDTTIDDYILNMPGNNFDESGKPVAGDAAHADPSLPGEPGRPPLPRNTRAFNKGGAQPSSAAVRAPGAKAFLDRLNLELEVIERHKALTPSQERRIEGENRPRPIDPAVRDDGANDAARVMFPELQTAVRVLERGLLDTTEGKAFDPKTVMDRLRKSESWTTFREMVTDAINKGAMRAISAAAVHQLGVGRAADDLDYEAIAKEVIFRTGGVNAITNNLKKEIVGKVAQAVQEGKSRAEVDRIIRESIDFWRETQAETVALTEAVHAYNESTLAVAEATGHTHVVVEDGRDHDQPCIDADGQVWTIDKARSNRLEHPRCRRAFTPYPVEA